ncbi:MAG: hypothetical protein PHN72_04940 [Bacilli bacterium]|nr:hypothetical protein [Bacilli bacterium]
MFDIHAHILNGIDDGSKSIEESLAILTKLKKLGFSAVVATPHYMDGSSYVANNKTKVANIKKIYKKLKEKKLDIELYLGNEVFILDELEDYIKNEEISSINDSKYILIELPFALYPVHLEEYIFKLISHNWIPIIAHPERYAYFQKDPSKMVPLIEQGVLFQSNFASMIGRYGSKAKEALIYLLKHNMVHFLATDIHSAESSFYDRFEEIKNHIIELIGKDKFTEITEENPRRVIRNENIEITDPILDVKKSLLAFFARK